MAFGCLLVLTGAAVPGQWEQIFRLTAEDAAAGDYFGCSVSVIGGTIVLGASYDEDAGSSSGSAYVFEESISCPADVNGDGIADVLDLLEVLAAWGPCE